MLTYKHAFLKAQNGTYKTSKRTTVAMTQVALLLEVGSTSNGVYNIPTLFKVTRHLN